MTFLATGERTGYFVLDSTAVVKIDLPVLTVATKKADVRSSLSRRERLNADPRKAAALQRARSRIAQELDANSVFSITKLRLDAGLSQADLARIMDTQQPAIARLERGQTEPKLSTIRKLADAFRVSPETVLAACINTQRALKKA